MHERTRKLICRLGFVAICLVPTLSLLSWVAWLNSPLYRSRLKREWEAAIAARTGMTPHIGAIQPTRQNTIVMEAIELVDVETRERIALIRRAEVAVRAERAVVLLQQPEFKTSHLPLVVEAVQRQLKSASPTPARTVTLEIHDLTLHADRKADDCTLSELHGIWETTDSGPRVSLDFYLAGVRMKEAARVVVARNRQVSPPQTAWELQTGSTPLPCPVLTDCLAPLASLGRRSTFRGSVWAMEGAAGWNADLSGEFDGVDLDQLITAQFPHKLSGTARLVLNRASFQNGQLELASGSIYSSQGVVSQSLLQATGDWLHTSLAGELENSAAAIVPYGQMAFGFDMDDRGITLHGQCAGSTPAVMFTDARGTALVSSSDATLPAVALVRTLVPRSEIQVPATRETRSLLRCLPVPAVVPPERIGTRPPYSPLRLDGE